MAASSTDPARASGATDEALLARVAEHDPAALAELYDRHASLAYGVALRVTASVPAAEDAVQEAFLALWRTPTAFDPQRGSARSWLLAIVHHRAIDHVRRRRRSGELPGDPELTADALVLPDVWPEVAGRIEAAEVRAALGGLPDAQREAIELAYWGGLTQAQIATQTGAPLGTVKGRMRLGLLALGRALGSDRPPDQRTGPTRFEAPAGGAAAVSSGLDSMASHFARLCRLVGASARWLFAPWPTSDYAQ